MTAAQDIEAAEKFAKEFDVLAHTRTDNWIEEFQRCFLAGIAHAFQARRLTDVERDLIDAYRSSRPTEFSPFIMIIDRLTKDAK